jgi:hypothetical protein
MVLLLMQAQPQATCWLPVLQPAAGCSAAQVVGWMPWALQQLLQAWAMLQQPQAS